MTIHTRFIVQCDPCERYLGSELRDSAATTDSFESPLFLDYPSAYAEAVRRGWNAYPLTCPDCATARKESSK